MVASALRVTTTTDRAVYQRLEVVTVTAVVTVAGLPVSGATARFVVKKADGQRVIVRVPTNASGIATYQYLIDAADPPGAWAARVVARKAGIIGQGRKGFQVQ